MISVLYTVNSNINEFWLALRVKWCGVWIKVKRTKLFRLMRYTTTTSFSWDEGVQNLCPPKMWSKNFSTLCSRPGIFGIHVVPKALDYTCSKSKHKLKTNTSFLKYLIFVSQRQSTPYAVRLITKPIENPSFLFLLKIPGNTSKI